MIGIIDLCSTPGTLHRREFVRPVSDILAGEGIPFRVVRYNDTIDTSDADGIILCGVALMDNAYFEDLPAFGWLADVTVPLLGICAGFHVMLSGEWSRTASMEVGKVELVSARADDLLGLSRGDEVYCLHSFAMRPEGEDWVILAESRECVQAVRHRKLERWGLLFHPEVMNKDIIARFGKMCMAEKLPAAER